MDTQKMLALDAAHDGLDESPPWYLTSEEKQRVEALEAEILEIMQEAEVRETDAVRETPAIAMNELNKDRTPMIERAPVNERVRIYSEEIDVDIMMETARLKAIDMNDIDLETSESIIHKVLRIEE